MAAPKKAGITGIAADTDVGDPVVERETVQRRVGLDEPPVRLRLERGDEFATVGREQVEPRRDLGKWPVEQPRPVTDRCPPHRRRH